MGTGTVSILSACSQRNCQSTFRYGLATFGRSYLILAWCVVVIVHVVCNYLSYFWRRCILSDEKFILTMCSVT